MIGIYQIMNLVTGQRYIGQSVKCKARIGQHLSYLRRGVHCNRHMQASFKKHGAAVFEGRVLCITSRVDLSLYERLLIAGYRSDQRKFGFNLTIATDDRLTHTPEARAAISAALRKRKPYERTPEIRAKIAASLAGKPGINRGRKFSAETRAKMAAAKLGKKHQSGMTGKTHSKETRDRIASSLKDRYGKDPALGDRLSASAKKRYERDSSHIERINAARRGTKHTVETRAKMSASHRRRLAEHRSL